MHIQFYEDICCFLSQAISVDRVDRLSSLPDEMIIKIFKNLDLTGLRCVAIVSRKFNVIQKLPAIWEIQAKYFGIKLKEKSSRTYKSQVRHIRLRKGRFDLFNNAISYQRSISDEERKVFCQEVASYFSPNNFIKIHSQSGEKAFCASIDANRKIHFYDVLETDLIPHPLKRKSFF